MYNILIDDISANRKQFEEIHGAADYYGGSDCASIAGIGWNSPLEVWLRKTGKVAAVDVTDQMKYGSYMERFIIELLRGRLSAKDPAVKVESVNQVWQSKERPWMTVSPDALVQSELDPLGVAEFKAQKIYAAKYWSEELASDSALCQAQWAMAVSGINHCYCCALIGGDTDKFYYPKFESSKDVQAQLIAKVEEFREFVQKDIPPVPGPEDAKLIKEHLMQSITNEEPLDLTESHADLIAEYGDLSQEAEVAKGLAKELENKLKAIRNRFVQDCQGHALVKVGESVVKISEVTVSPFMNPGSHYFKTSVKLGK